MLNNRPLLITFFIFCAILSGTKIIFAQAVTDNSKEAQVNAALDENQQPSAASVKAPEPVAPPLTESVPSPKIVKAIEIEGNKSIGIAQILARIKTRVGEEYQEAVVSDDLKRLYNSGHFSDVQIDHEDLDNGYKVIVRLKEKPIVDEITFSKIRYYSKRYLLNKMKTKIDKFLDNKTLKDDINMIEDLSSARVSRSRSNGSMSTGTWLIRTRKLSRS